MDQQITSTQTSDLDSNMTITQSRIGGIAVVSVSGVIDMLTSPELEAGIGSAQQTDAEAVVVDLTDVEFLSSAGMSVLVAARERVGDGAKFAVVADSPATSRPIKLVGLAERIGLHATLDEAIVALGV